MDERDAMPTGSRTGLAVNEPHARRMETREVAVEIGRAVRDVMEGLSVAVEEATDGGVRAEGLEELELSDEGDADTLRFEGLGR